MIRIAGTVFSVLAGLAFGSFLNICLSLWLAAKDAASARLGGRDDESKPSWSEGLTFLGRLRSAHRSTTGSLVLDRRSALVILSVGAIWGLLGWRLMGLIVDPLFGPPSLDTLPFLNLEYTAGTMLFCLALVGLATLDTARFRGATFVTLPGVAVGIVFYVYTSERMVSFFVAETSPLRDIGERFIAVLAAAGLILLLRLVYWLVLRREGIGLGDVGLMAMLAAWLGLQGAILALATGILLGVFASIAILLTRRLRRSENAWALSPLPLGAFLCTGGIVSCLWGPQILATYLR
jgi:leader peptidase (prepilin peptidase)/N-methyltransferase